SQHSLSAFLGAVGVAALVFAAVAPTLSWLEFSSGSENLVVETVLEMRRGGPWLVPTLERLARTQKPPLPAWITAAAARPGTVADVHVALWVNIANVGLAWAVRRGRWWAGSLLAGAALGLAFMSKGPVSLLQTVLPVLGFVVWRRWATTGHSDIGNGAVYTPS